jgi:hypothetical protein
MVDMHGVHADNCGLKWNFDFSHFCYIQICSSLQCFLLVERHDIFGLVPTREFMYNFLTWEIIISLCYPIANVNGKRHGTVPLILYGLCIHDWCNWNLIENLFIFHTWELPMIGPLLQAENLKIGEKTHLSFSSSSSTSDTNLL